MLFRKKNQEEEIPKLCHDCEHAKILAGQDAMLCDKKGVVSCDYHCSRFSYDPLKRMPRPAPRLPEVSPEDFML